MSPFVVTREEMRAIPAGEKDRLAAERFPLARLLTQAEAPARAPGPPTTCREGGAWSAQWWLEDGGTVKVWAVPQAKPSPWSKPLPTGFASFSLAGRASAVIYHFQVVEDE